jgi:hypothetical protein
MLGESKNSIKMNNLPTTLKVVPEINTCVSSLTAGKLPTTGIDIYQFLMYIAVTLLRRLEICAAPMNS